MRRLTSVLGMSLWVAAGLTAPAFAGGADTGSARSSDQELPLAGVITNPDWLEKPSGEELSNYFPPVAQLLSLDGRATIVCDVNPLGETINCTVASEAPLGMGFGPAALALSKYFRMKPMQLDGTPVAGGRVRIPIHFAYPANADALPATPPDATTPPTPRALALAREIATINQGPDRMAAYAKQSRDYFNQRFADVSLTEQEQAAIDAYIDAASASGPLRIDTMAHRYAAMFSEAELAEIAAFFSSAGGKAWSGRP